MQLHQVTITGADDSTHVETLLSLQQKYPFVEWGILLSYNKAGTPKYPSADKLDRFSLLQTAAHLCGGLARGVFNHGDYGIMSKIHLMGFQRLQLNYNFSLTDEWSSYALPKFNELHPLVPVILQYNKANKKAVDGIMSNHGINLQVLYDSSGGRGTLIKEVQDPFAIYTGYSGGLGPDNVEEFIQQLVTHSDPSRVWIDMESNVRTGDELDLEKVERVLEICSKYITV